MIPTYKIEDFPSDKTIEHSFKLERFEDLLWPQNLAWPNKRNFYEITWVTEGTFTQVIDYHDIPIKSETLLISSPGQVHLLSEPEKIKGYSLAFTEQFLLTHQTQESIFELTFLEESFTRPYLCLDAAAQQELRAIIDPMIAELNRPVKVPLIVNGLLFVLLNRIQRLMSKEQSADLDTHQVLVYKQFKKLVEQYYKEDADLNFYAGKLYLSANYLNKIVKHLTGKTAGAVIRCRGLLEAKRMLGYCDLPIGEISSQLGFKDFSYFSRQFRNQEGVTPAEYRKQMYKKYLHK